jgi:hypothetical protein
MAEVELRAEVEVEEVDFAQILPNLQESLVTLHRRVPSASPHEVYLRLLVLFSPMLPQVILRLRHVLATIYQPLPDTARACPADACPAPPFKLVYAEKLRYRRRHPRAFCSSLSNQLRETWY